MVGVVLQLYWWWWWWRRLRDIQAWGQLHEKEPKQEYNKQRDGKLGGDCPRTRGGERRAVVLVQRRRRRWWWFGIQAWGQMQEQEAQYGQEAQGSQPEHGR